MLAVPEEEFAGIEFLNGESKEVMEMLAEKNNDIKKAYDLLKVISKDEKAKMVYESIQAEISDQRTRLKSAEERGIDKGKVEVAKNLLLMGMDISTVVKATGLNEVEIAKVKKNMH